MSNSDSKDDMTALVVRSDHDLATRSSLVLRGLRDISTGFQEDSGKLGEDRAQELLSQSKFEEAIAVCTAELDTNPKDERFWSIKGICFSKQEKYDEFLKCAVSLLEIDGKNPTYWYVAARVLHHLSKFEDELEHWRKLIEIDPQYKEARIGIGDCLFTLGRYQEAIQAFDSELDLNPSDDYCPSRRKAALAALSGQDAEAGVMFYVVFDSDIGWHAMKEDDIEWEVVSIESDGRGETLRPLQPCFGPFFSNYDPNEGPTGNGKALAEEFAEEKRRLNPNGSGSLGNLVSRGSRPRSVQKGQGS